MQIKGSGRILYWFLCVRLTRLSYQLVFVLPGNLSPGIVSVEVVL